MKDFSKLFETVMDFKGLSFLVTEKSLIKKQRPVFFFLPLLFFREKKFLSPRNNVTRYIINTLIFS